MAGPREPGRTPSHNRTNGSPIPCRARRVHHHDHFMDSPHLLVRQFWCLPKSGDPES